jgi:hypothetical protein
MDDGSIDDVVIIYLAEGNYTYYIYCTWTARPMEDP